MGDRCTWTTSTTWFVTCELRLRCVGAGARGAPAHAPATWNDGVDGALLCHLLFSLHDDQAHGAYAGPGTRKLRFTVEQSGWISDAKGKFMTQAQPVRQVARCA